MTEPVFSRVNFALVSRGQGGNAVKAAAYNLCGRLQHDGARFDFRRKRGEHVGGTVLLPAGAPESLRDSGALWRAAEAAEKRHDAQTARQILLSIPREVPPELRLPFAEAVARPWVDDGAACQIDVHCPRAADGDEQPHAHIMLTLRRVTDAGLAKVKAREWNTAFREDGGKAERRRVEERANAFLAAHGIAARIDLRSLADQGIDHPPEPTVPRQDWQRWLREGGVPEAAPVTVGAALAHRQQRAALATADLETRKAAEEAADLVREIQRADPAPQEDTMPPRPTRAPARRRPAPARRPAPRPQQQQQPEPWMRRVGGLDALPGGSGRRLRPARAADQHGPPAFPRSP